MRTRCILLSLVVVSAVSILAPEGLQGRSAEQPKKPQIDLDHVPKPIICLPPGSEFSLALGWDFGTGRAPVFTMSADAEPTEVGFDHDAPPRHEQDGIALTMDQQTWQHVSDQLSAAKFYGRQPDGTYKHFTNCAVKVQIAEDATPGVYRRYVHNISGTGRHMKLTAELLIVVERAAD